MVIRAVEAAGRIWSPTRLVTDRVPKAGAVSRAAALSALLLSSAGDHAVDGDAGDYAVANPIVRGATLPAIASAREEFAAAVR